MRLTVKFDRELDRRWIAEVAELPGVLAYGKTKWAARRAAARLALRVLADRLEHGDRVIESSSPEGSRRLGRRSARHPI